MIIALIKKRKNFLPVIGRLENKTIALVLKIYENKNE